MLKNIIDSVKVATLLTVVSYVVAYWFGWIVKIDPIEAFAVFTSYSCTWLCTVQSRWNYPIGVVSVIAYAILFYLGGSPALALFNLYLVFSLAYGWFRWGQDENTRPVTTVKLFDWGGYILLGLFLYAAYIGINAFFEVDLSKINQIDIILAAASGVAQLLLDNKKLENWVLWAVINVISIPYFVSIGLYAVAFQYVFFLVNTVIGFVSWNGTRNEETKNWGREPKPY